MLNAPPTCHKRPEESVGRPRGLYGRNGVYGSYLIWEHQGRWLGAFGAATAAGQGRMSDPSGSDPSGPREGAREAAKTIADQIAPLLKRARAKRFDFLAYLLAMALKESRRLFEEQSDGP